MNKMRIHQVPDGTVIEENDTGLKLTVTGTIAVIHGNDMYVTPMVFEALKDAPLPGEPSE